MNQENKRPPIQVIGLIALLFLLLSAINVWATPTQDTSLRWTVPTFTPTATPRTGSLCVEVYHDHNRDGLRQPTTEELLAGAVVRVTDHAGSLVTSTTTSAGIAACLGALEPGLYVVYEQSPPGYVSTTDEVWGAVITSNVTISIPFGEVYTGARRLYLPLITRLFERNP